MTRHPSNWRVRFEPLLTPLFRTYWRFARPMTLGVRALVTDSNGHILLVRHTYSKGWHFPGGGVERGETTLDAVLRETAEEGGVEAIGTPSLLALYSNHANYPNDHVALYRFADWRACAPKQNGEIAERRFFARDALPADISKGTRRRIAEIFDGAPIAAAW